VKHFPAPRAARISTDYLGIAARRPSLFDAASRSSLVWFGLGFATAMLLVVIACRLWRVAP